MLLPLKRDLDYYTLKTELTQMARLFHLALALVFSACSSQDEPPTNHEVGEYIYRNHDEYLFIPAPPVKVKLEPYPWEKDQVANLPKITKEFFRCKGSRLNPDRVIEHGEKITHLSDCGGTETHSLPLRNEREFIYPAFIELLNYVQATTGKRVVVTSGHRCPQHNIYVDPSPSNQSSKHMIGAEMSFYVQGMEYQPEKIVKILMDYYAGHREQEYRNFVRYEKGSTNVSTPPWYNKEIFIKQFLPSEGRNYDNRHPYPYIAIQLRYDRDLKENVVYSWDMAIKNYLRK
jgi:hypothetical protein